MEEWEYSVERYVNNVILLYPDIIFVNSDDTAALGLTLDSLDRALAITDASGTWNFTYDPKGWLVKETVPAMVNGEVIHGYDAYGRRTELRTASGSRTFTYDVQNRVASIGNSGGSLHYTYRSGLQQLDTASWRNGEGVELNSRTFAYDSYHRLTGIKLNGVSEVGYTLNDRDQRTAASYAVGGMWSYSYDEKSQVTGATGNNTTFSYAYDGVGNRLTAQEGASQFSYTSNLLNQYTQVNTAQPTYDADGNMLTTGDGWTYAWNGENRLIRAEKDGTIVEMNYDYAGRRFEKKVYVNSEAGTPGTLQHHYKYVYDGYKLVELYDNDTLLVSFTWQPESVGGLDVPVSMTYAGNTYSYVTDGNKNVTALLDAAGFRVAGYTYGPFGQVLSMDGALAEVNPFRFSSEFHDDETGLVYYNYRYYNPSLGRWTKRDPIEERGSQNLYSIAHNNLVNAIDRLGLLEIPDEQVQETDKLVLLKGIEAGAGVNEFTFSGKNLFRIGGTSYYVSTVPHPEVGMRVPKTGTTSVYFIWQKGNTKKLYRLDTAHTGANFNHHNRDGLYKLIPVQNHSPSPHATRYVTTLRLFKIGGRFLFAAAIASDAYSIYRAENRTREVVRAVAGWSGMLAGAWGGAKLGIAGGAYAGVHAGGIGVVPGTMIGGGLGGIIGGAIGYWAGSEIAVTVYDWYFQKLESEDATVCIVEE